MSFAREFSGLAWLAGHVSRKRKKDARLHVIRIQFGVRNFAPRFSAALLANFVRC